MKDEIHWLDDALSTKDTNLIMTHYLIKDNEIRATDGRILASYPCEIDGEFLVPGEELQTILHRLPAEPKIKQVDGRVNLSCGRFRGSIQTLDLRDNLWRFPEDHTPDWQPFPAIMLAIWRDLRPFISANAIHRWACGLSLTDGWALASSNVVLAGAECDIHVSAIIPSWVIDFVMARKDRLTQWAITDHYMAFRWSNGAWMRSTLIDDQFPEAAAKLIKQKIKPTQKIDRAYREAVQRIASLSKESVSIYHDRVIGRTDYSEISEALTSEIPADNDCSRWGSEFVDQMMTVATAWSPSQWPKPTPFIGERVVGFIAGRR